MTIRCLVIGDIKKGFIMYFTPNLFLLIRSDIGSLLLKICYLIRSTIDFVCKRSFTFRKIVFIYNVKSLYLF